MTRPKGCNVQRDGSLCRSGTLSDEIYARIEGRMRCLASQLLARSVAVSRWEQTDDILQESLIRVFRALETTDVQSPLHLYRLAAQQVRRVLIDLSRKYRGPHGLATHYRTGTHVRQLVELMAAEDTQTRMGVTEWSEFHRIVSELPVRHREAFDLMWYAGLTTREAAGVLGVSQREVQRRWREARLLFCRRWDAEVEGGHWLDGFATVSG